MKHIHIMTSCDDNLIAYILPQMASIAENLSDRQITLYLFHNRVSKQNLELLKNYSEKTDNIKFVEIYISDITSYETLSYLGGGWPFEAYFTLCCHDFLPQDLDRVLYIDAGDVIINGAIDEFYFADFEGKSIIAAYPRIKKENGDVYEKSDLSDINVLKAVCQGGVINSGSFVINLEKFRKNAYPISEHVKLSREISSIFPNDKMAYFGDQGLISAAFVGDILYLGYNKDDWSPLYTPYNFGMWYGSVDMEYLWFTPKVIHYTGNNLIKPWQARFCVESFDKFDFKEGQQGFEVTKNHIKYHEIWWKHCEKTPVYDELNKIASACARELEKRYFPLCQKYNELAEKYQDVLGKCIAAQKQLNMSNLIAAKSRKPQHGKKRR